MKPSNSKIIVYDAEGTILLTYSWKVSAGTLIGSYAEPEVQWTAPEIPPERNGSVDSGAR